MRMHAKDQFRRCFKMQSKEVKKKQLYIKNGAFPYDELYAMTREDTWRKRNHLCIANTMNLEKPKRPTF